MTASLALRFFFVCLVSCAALAIGAIWFGEHQLAPVYFQTTATLFILGLASFLTWFTLTMLSIRKRLLDKDV